MSMIGKNCQWVIVFSHTVLILLYLLSENTQFIDVIHVFTDNVHTCTCIMCSCCNVKKSKISAKLNSEDNIILKNKTASVE